MKYWSSKKGSLIKIALEAIASKLFIYREIRQYYAMLTDILLLFLLSIMIIPA